MNYVYILRLSDNSYYVGSCDEMAKRFDNHSRGKVRSTKSRLPARIIYTEKFKTRPEARKREKQIKKWKSRKAIERLINKANMTN